jgi:hypothetical protein
MMNARIRKQLVRPRPPEEEGNIDWERDDYDDLFDDEDASLSESEETAS